MGYYLNAILGNIEQLQGAASTTPPAVVVRLTGELGLIPLTEELFDAITNSDSRDYEEGKPSFTYLSARVAVWINRHSAGLATAYVEAEYFGGIGSQSAVVWKGGAEVLPPTTAKDSINQALRILGVRADVGRDEFETVGRGRHRTIEDWVAEREVNGK